MKLKFQVQTQLIRYLLYFGNRKSFQEESTSAELKKRLLLKFYFKDDGRKSGSRGKLVQIVFATQGFTIILTHQHDRLGSCNSTLYGSPFLQFLFLVFSFLRSWAHSADSRPVYSYRFFCICKDCSSFRQGMPSLISPWNADDMFTWLSIQTLWPD